MMENRLTQNIMSTAIRILGSYGYSNKSLFGLINQQMSQNRFFNCFSHVLITQLTGICEGKQPSSILYFVLCGWNV